MGGNEGTVAVVLLCRSKNKSNRVASLDLLDG